MNTDKPLMTAAIVLSVFGMGMGIGLIIASFIVGLGTDQGSALSSSGTTVSAAFTVSTIVLTTFSRRAQRTGSRPRGDVS